jgi:hypothetical protein
MERLGHARREKLMPLPSKNMTANLSDLIRDIETSSTADRDVAARALEIVRDGVITGEGPTTMGRIHFSRSLDVDDAAWCARILTSMAVTNLPVSRAEVETLFEINDAASERTDDGRFDDLFAKAVIHHAVSASGMPVPPRSVALSPETSIESWGPTQAIAINAEVLKWVAGQMRGKRHSNHTLKALVGSLIGVAALPIAQTLPHLFDVVGL